MPAFKHYPPVVLGNHIPAKTITLERIVGGNVISLDSATVTFTLSRGGRVYFTADNAAEGGLTIVDSVNAIVNIAAIDTASLSAASYDHLLSVEYSDGIKVDFVAGNIDLIAKHFNKFNPTKAA